MPVLNAAAIAALVKGAGVADDQIATVAVAVALAESGGVTDGVSAPQPLGGRDRGLWRINSRWHPEVSDRCALDPVCSTQQAMRISNGGRNWSQWRAFTNGAYQRHMAAARAGVDAGARPVATGDIDWSDPDQWPDDIKPPERGGIHIPGIDPTQPLKPFNDLGEFIGRLMDPAAWKRLGTIVAGVVLALVGFAIINRDAIAGAAGGAIVGGPVGAAIGAVTK